MSNNISVKCGTNNMSIATSKRICNEEAKKLINNLNINDGQIVSIPFWTDDFWPELICIGLFKKNESGEVEYELDFAESTLY